MSFSYGLGTLRRLSVPSKCLSVNISRYRISSKTTGRILFKSWSECFPQCLVVQVPKRIPVRRQTWPPSAIFDFFLVIASPQKLLDGFKWNLPIVFASVPSCASTEKIAVRRQIWPFGSRLGLSEISYWQTCYRISFKTAGRICLDLGQNVPFNV